MSDIDSISCSHDGAWRSPDLSQPCPGCGSKNFFGRYLYPYERKQMIMMIAIIVAVIFCAILAGAIFLVVTRMALL